MLTGKNFNPLKDFPVNHRYKNVKMYELLHIVKCALIYLTLKSNIFLSKIYPCS